MHKYSLSILAQAFNTSEPHVLLEKERQGGRERERERERQRDRETEGDTERERETD